MYTMRSSEGKTVASPSSTTLLTNMPLFGYYYGMGGHGHVPWGHKPDVGWAGLAWGP
jgi:hypothetical protein